MASIRDKDRKMLWGRSAGVCSICKKQLFEDESLSDDPSILGQECHIVGEEDSAKSPRGLYPLPLDRRNFFDNLILLCRDHHKVIDDQPEKYTVEDLHKVKNEHLIWVRQNLGLDEARQLDDETYAGLVDKWSQLAMLDDWEGFTYCILSGDAPIVGRQRWAAFEELHEWLFNRVYPERYPNLNSSFENFRLVLHDFRKVFLKYAEPCTSLDNYLETSKIYKIRPYDEMLHERMMKEYDDHVRLLEDLVLELTRAANYLSDRIRQHVLPSFRVREGVLIARTGIWADGSDRSLRVSYRDRERTDIPYPGLDDFMSVRLQRDFFYACEQ